MIFFKELDTINFKPIEKADKPIFDKFFRIGYCESSKYTFTNIFMWRDLYDLRWAVEGDVLYIFAGDVAWQPFGAAKKMPGAIEKVLELTCEFAFLEKSFVAELEKYPAAQFEISADKSKSDYVYSAQDLINLSGRKFHGKKNHLNQFYKDYPAAEYAAITAEIIPHCLERLDAWYEMQVANFPALRENLSHERHGISEVFEDFEFFGLKGGAILLGGKVAAFTFGELLNSNTAVIHVEKADAEIRGAYTAINQQFLANEWASVEFVNREEDLGIEGLRRAKESYRPIKMVDKFSAKVIA